MANLQKHRTHESLNIETAAEWSVQAALDISDAGEVTSNVSNISQIGFYSDSDVYVRFDTSTSDTIVNANDLIIPGETLAFLNVPKGVGDTMYVHFKQVTSAASKSLRIVHL